jgi:hypothetical protein
MKNRCAGRSTSSYVKGDRCCNNGNYEHEGKYYCKLHVPVTNPDNTMQLRKALHLACVDLVDGATPTGKDQSAKGFAEFYLKEALLDPKTGKAE